MPRNVISEGNRKEIGGGSAGLAKGRCFAGMVLSYYHQMRRSYFFPGTVALWVFFLGCLTLVL
jgi:hypothetical protein